MRSKLILLPLLLTACTPSSDFDEKSFSSLDSYFNTYFKNHTITVYTAYNKDIPGHIITLLEAHNIETVSQYEDSCRYYTLRQKRDALVTYTRWHYIHFPETYPKDSLFLHDKNCRLISNFNARWCFAETTSTD